MLESKESNKLGFLALLASSSTLICCALPGIFVALGAGATLASIVNIFPELILISKYKIYISIFTLVFLLCAGILIRKSSLQPCPTDPSLKDTCMKTRKRTNQIYTFSVLLFVLASVFTYIVPVFL